MSGVINLVTIQGDGPPHFSCVGKDGSLYTTPTECDGSRLNNRGSAAGVRLSRLQSAGVKYQ